MLQKTFGRILGCALLSYGSTALAFTLLEGLTPSTTVTNSFTLDAQVGTSTSRPWLSRTIDFRCAAPSRLP